MDKGFLTQPPFPAKVDDDEESVIPPQVKETMVTKESVETNVKKIGSRKKLVQSAIHFVGENVVLERNEKTVRRTVHTLQKEKAKKTAACTLKEESK